MPFALTLVAIVGGLLLGIVVVNACAAWLVPCARTL
jgi:hypothetical protein